ncbi:MAG TPA: deoxyhypusine synthase, partial [Thermoplasmata archaeon]|nr:deoxyhypusine synthase [Thermoplasmata archaeon]
MKKQPVRDIQFQKNMTTDQLIKELYDAGGFSAKKVAEGVDILERMIREKECVKFLSFPACIISTGTRGVIKELVKRKLVDVIITTTGTLDHDLARVWKDYYHGSFMADDTKLHQQGINRLGNIFIPLECYGTILEKKIQPVLGELYTDQQKWSTKDLIWEFGKRLEKEKNGRDSILYWAWKNKIPMYVPGITDGAFGAQLWMYYQEHRNFTIDLFKDEQDLSDIVFDAKKTGALIIGGGISKHHVIWWNQFRGGLDHAIYLTTAVEYDGSLSGAQIREAVSWGKVKK